MFGVGTAGAGMSVVGPESDGEVAREGGHDSIGCSSLKAPIHVETFCDTRITIRALRHLSRLVKPA